jgi:hypothetical protein
MSNNKIILEGCIKTFKESNEIDLNESETFELFSITQVHKDKNITFENIVNSIVDGGNDGGIDSIMIFVDDEFIENIDEIEEFTFTNKTNTKFIITQCKKESSFKEGVLDKLITTIPVLLDLEKNETALLSRFNSDVVELSLVLIETWKRTAISGGNISLEYNYISNASEIQINQVFTQKIDQLIDLSKRVLSSNNISFNAFSCKELLEFYQKQKSNRISIEFKDRPLITEFENNGIGYIGTVKLAKYKEFLKSENGDIRDDLFESNIRHFQGLVDVNKKIKNTVENITNEDFWWLNNGITIIAEEPKELGKKLSIENIQIVNGLQTSYSIFNNHNGDENDNRSVLVKVIINTNKETTDNIIASTNNQNPVSPTLLRATEPIQRNLELFFQNEGFYYDRRKNYYKNQGKPATKIFSIQVTAQSIESIVYDNPHSARSTPTTLLKNESNYSRIFDKNKNFKGYLNCCLAHNKAHSYWLRNTDSELKSKTSNFKLHLSCILIKTYFKRRLVTFQDLTDLDINQLDQKTFDESIIFLNQNIDSFLSENQGANLINIAKSKDFTEYLFNKIQEKYKK